MGPTVLVTGASTGLGLAIARMLMERDYRVILTARPSSMHRFAELGIQEGPRVWLRPLDVTVPEQREAVIAEVEERWGGLDVLVNNAGVSVRSVVEHVTDEIRREQMSINFRSPMELTRLSLPGMRARRKGRIVNVSSVGGMMAMPTMAVYSASKFALEGACEALWYEVRPWNVRVSLVEPGFINSDGFEKVWTTPLAEAATADQRSPYHAHYVHMQGFIGRIMRRVPSTPERVAATVVRVIEHPDPPLRVPATIDAWMFAWLRRLLPRRIYHLVLYWSLPGVRRWGPRPGMDEGRPALVRSGDVEQIEPR